MNKTAAFLMIIIAFLCFMLGSTLQSKAQSKSFAGVLPFVSNDHLGFMDQSNGKIYIYDNNFSQCIFAGQITDLGQPIQPQGKS